MTNLEEAASAFDLKNAIATLIISSFGFVAALFWRDAINEFLDKFVPAGEGVLYSFFVAIIVTIIAVITIYIVSKWTTFSLRRNLTSAEARTNTIKRLQKLDNKLLGRDITIRKGNGKGQFIIEPRKGQSKARPTPARSGKALENAKARDE